MTKTTKGLYLDTVAEDTPVGYMTFAKNVLLSEKLGIVQNEKGFLYHVQVPYTIIGVLGVLNTTVFWSVNSTGFSEIGIVQTDEITGITTYKKVINDLDIPSAPFKFNLNNPIDAEFHITANGDIVVAWIDELNTPKIVNLNSVLRDLEAIPVVPIQPNDLELFPAAQLRTPVCTVEQFGGALLTGVHKITYYYEDDDGSTSNYAALSKPLGIIKDPNTNSPDQVWGIEAGVSTSKAIKIQLQADSNWSFVNFVAVKTIGGVTTAVKFKRVPVKNQKPTPPFPFGLLAYMTVLYTGTEAEETVSLNEILTPRALYTNAKAITQLNNRLHLGNLTTAEEIRIQQTACNVKIKWKATKVDVDEAISREGSGWKGETFTHGEAYAFYLQVRDARTGVWTKGFHIPGRVVEDIDRTLLTPSPSAGPYKSGNNSPQFQKYQLEDTITSAVPGSGGGTSIVTTPLNRPVNIVSPYEPAVFPAFGGWDPALFSQANFDNSTGFITTATGITFNGSVLYPGFKIVVAATPSYVIFQHTFSGNEVTTTTEMITTVVTTPPGDYFIGTMGAWENKNETYPDDPSFNGKLLDSGPLGVDLTPSGTPGGQPQLVRHHKFPTLAFMKEKFLDSNYGKTILDRLTIEVENVAFPADLQGVISGWRICYAKRNVNDATVLGMGGTFFFGKGEFSKYLKPIPANGTVVQNIDENYNKSIILSRAFASGLTTVEQATEGANFIRFHAFNLMVDKPSITPTYLRREWHMRVLTPDNDPGPEVEDDDDPRIITDGDEAAVRKWVLYDARKDSAIIQNIILPDKYRFRNVKFIQYLPTDAIISSGGFSINNICGEDCLLLQNNVAGLSVADKVMELVGAAIISNVINLKNVEQQTNVCSLCQLKTDIYSGFELQELVATDLVKELGKNDSVTIPTILNNIGGGDSWLGYHSEHVQGPVNDEVASHVSPGEELQGWGSKGVHYMPMESPKNLNYRHADVSDPQTQFYDKYALRPKILTSEWNNLYLGHMNIELTPKYLYNPDYNTLNDVGVNLQGFDYTIDSETLFPTTVARSIANAPESNVINWKTFLISDRYTMPRNKGVIENLQGVGNQRLFIHHTDTLYITKDRTTLEATIAQVTLGSGDIFDITPFEVLSTDQGYAGTRHKFACVVTKVGYIFPDMSQGKIFLHDGEALNEISKNGLRQFWRDHLNKDLIDNPFIGQGVTITYDETYNRILVTMIDKPNNKFITASYSPQLESWCSFHDHDSNFLYALRGNRTFSVKSPVPGEAPSDVYIHNKGAYGRYFNLDPSLVPYPMLAELLYNDGGYAQKNFTAVDWVSQVIDPTGIELTQETFDFITGRSSRKGTGKIAVVKYTELVDAHFANTRLTEKSWGFNKFRNLVAQYPGVPILLPFEQNFELNPAAINPDKDWYEEGRIIDNYLAVRFEYLNANNNKFLLMDHSIKFRQSIR